MDKKPLTEDQLVTIIDAEINSAIGALDSELSSDREYLLDRYYGEDYGNEIEGRSRVKTREVFEAVEWILPSMLQKFATGQRSHEFEPEFPGDEEQVEIITDACRHVLFKDNPGFNILQIWIKDGLLQRNGTVKIYWEDKEVQECQYYEGLDEDGLLKLMSDPNIEPVEQAIRVNEDGMTVFDLKINKMKQAGVVIENVPPEEFSVGRNSRSQDYNHRSNTFCNHNVPYTRAELKDMGFPAEKVDMLHGTTGVINSSSERDNRRKDDTRGTGGEAALSDFNSIVFLDESYIRIDYDGDGTSELRKVLKGDTTVLENIVVDDVPFETWTPIPMGHKWSGLAAADMVVDLQEQNTSLKRQMFDNLYQVNASRVAYNERVNLDDLLTLQPNGTIEVEGEGPVGDSLMPLVVQPVIQYVVPALEMQLKEFGRRTGISENSMGGDPAVLAQSTQGAFDMALERGDLRQDAIERAFAEALKRLYLHIYRLLCEHQDYARAIQVKKEWVTFDPRDWQDRKQVETTVGLGNGNRSRKLAQITEVIRDQQEHLKMGSPMVTYQNLFNSYNKAIQLMELGDVEDFYTNPDPNTLKQSDGPSPEEKVMQLTAMLEQRDQDLRAAQEKRKADLKAMEIHNKQMKDAFDNRIKWMQTQVNMTLANAKLKEAGSPDHTITVEKLKSDTELKKEMIAQHAETGREHIRQQNETVRANAKAENNESDKQE